MIGEFDIVVVKWKKYITIYVLFIPLPTLHHADILPSIHSPLMHISKPLLAIPSRLPLPLSIRRLIPPLNIRAQDPIHNPQCAIIHPELLMMQIMHPRRRKVIPAMHAARLDQLRCQEQHER